MCRQSSPLISRKSPPGAELLKQGSYNYRYGARLHKGDTTPNFSLIEGDHYETRNEYTVDVYHRAPGSRYDRLIGSAIIYSQQ